MPVAIRPYGPDDAPDVVALSLRAWAPVFASLREVLGDRIFERLHPDWRADQERAVRDELSGPSPAWVAEVDGAVAGFVAVGLRADRGIGEIEMLAVDPRHQGAGVGLALTSFAIGRIGAAGMTVAMVQTGGDQGHAPARRVYERAGFRLLPSAQYFLAL
jgi:ribosomal protein S18 acetylase RimI-like enzyme